MTIMTRPTAGPPDAKIGKDGARRYYWPNPDGGEYECLSVTSVRKLLGQPFGLVNWQMGKIIDRALTEEFAAKFSQREDSSLLRKWLRAATTEERDKAAAKGLDIHGALEMGFTPDQCNDETRPYVAQVRSFLDDTGATIVAQEFTCWNLTSGYAGTADVLLQMPDGQMVLGDWKTSKGVHVDHIIQLHAYLAAEFVGQRGIPDESLTEKIRSCGQAGILHLRHDGWTWHEVPFRQDVLAAFLGAVEFAKLVSVHDKPDRLFAGERSGSA